MLIAQNVSNKPKSAPMIDCSVNYIDNQKIIFTFINDSLNVKLKMKTQDFKLNDLKESSCTSFKNTILLVFLMMLLPISKLIAQDAETYFDEDTVSCITAYKYIINPTGYLKYIDSTKIPNGILIDRTIFRSDIGLFNGKSKVKTCDYYIWKRLYNSLKYSYNDTGYFPPVNLVRETAGIYDSFR